MSATFLDVLDLEEVDRDIYRSRYTVEGRPRLYGGQVAAQALLAAGLTVEADRRPHSLHGYFLRTGDAARPTAFRVDRDRDGRSFSARRVVALQRGEVIFNMSCSFQVGGDSLDRHDVPLPAIAPPGDLPSYAISFPSIEMQVPPQPDEAEGGAYPSHFWARVGVPLGDDPLRHACAMTYLSDMGTGLVRWVTDGEAPGPSLDHAVWFHRPLRADDWMRLDFYPRSVSTGRGLYIGSISSPEGEVGCSIAQEALFRRRRDA
ncbi:MAG TPA: acyl-CoA thioesterase domain-containing protein [Mycobacteriales bacterium]|nr:acyl-CoA thioesterase domain-containing protein [Mycobacteriales bacterium]